MVAEVRSADRKQEGVGPRVVEGVAESWIVRLESLWVVLVISSRRRLARPGIRFAEVAEDLVDVRQGIQLAAEQDH